MNTKIQLLPLITWDTRQCIWIWLAYNNISPNDCHWYWDGISMPEVYVIDFKKHFDL